LNFKIDTGDAYPKKQAVGRVPFAGRQEIANQLAKMQQMGVIITLEGMLDGGTRCMAVEFNVSRLFITWARTV